MASIHSSCFRALKWLHFLLSNPFAASTASLASSPASYNAWMQHCVITAGTACQRQEQEQDQSRNWERTRLDGSLQDVVQAGHDVHLLRNAGLDKVGVGCEVRGSHKQRSASGNFQTGLGSELQSSPHSALPRSWYGSLYVRKKIASAR